MKAERMRDPVDWIYLSPHFDDVALSCGGLVWEQAQVGNVAVWTVCAGMPGSIQISPFAAALHERWEGLQVPAGRSGGKTGDEIIRVRQSEDEAACRILGARQRLLTVLDCIYRTAPGESGHALYASEIALFGPVHPREAELVDQLTAQLAQMLPAQAMIVCPLALGNHVDHQLVRQAVEATGRPLWYYADYPYVRIPGVRLPQDGWLAHEFQVSEAGLSAWGDAVAAYRSQITTFWQDEHAMRADLRDYGFLGVRLWRSSSGFD